MRKKKRFDLIETAQVVAAASHAANQRQPQDIDKKENLTDSQE